MHKIQKLTMQNLVEILYKIVEYIIKKGNKKL